MLERLEPAEVARYAAEQYPSPDEWNQYDTLVHNVGRHFEQVLTLEDRPIELRYPRRSRPEIPNPADDPFAAIAYRFSIPGGDGPLSGLRVGVKATIPVAGVPLPIAADVFEVSGTAVPTEDAVVVERLLGAGAEITATTKVGFPGLARSRPDDTRNPLDPRLSPGGSSAGSAAMVAAGAADAALGTDGAGSVRIPAAWCGLVGMKPTRGLVPNHGSCTSAIGPITRSVQRNAQLLDAIAGPDWRDSDVLVPLARDRGSYADAAGGALVGMRVAVIVEAVESVGCGSRTRSAFSDAERLIRALGADVSRVSLPLWSHTAAIFWPLEIRRAVLDAAAFGVGTENAGRTEKGIAAALVDLHNEPSKRALRLLVDQVRRTHRGVPFTRAQNLARWLRKHLDDLLEQFDVIVTPTTPTGPFRLSDAPVSVDLATINTWGFNMTGHPALTLPVGIGDEGLPFGLQIAGRPFDEHRLYQAAFAIEAAV